MPLAELAPDVFRFADTCNVYVLRDGDAAVLIDFGDGGVVDHLPAVGVRRVEWVLFTHHHREQLQGWPRRRPAGAKAAGPQAERELFETPQKFRPAAVTLGDPFTVHGASYVRPPAGPVPLDRGFAPMDVFAWRGREVWCVATPGDSPGAMSYLLKTTAGWVGFTGDLVCAGGTTPTWFDGEWDYGFGAGVYARSASAALVAGFDPVLLLPSHGREIKTPAADLGRLMDKLRAVERATLRGWEVNTFAAGAQDRVSRPSAVPHVWRVTPHLYKFRGPNVWYNFTILVADSGRALVVDCGLMDPAFLDAALAVMRDRLGLKGIDAVFVTHAHGDHFLEAEHLRQTWGAKLWTMAGVEGPCEQPHRFDFPAPVQAYAPSIKRGITGVKFDRLIPPGGAFAWEGYTFAVDWMPGQTAFACCLHGEIDGKRVAFTGDNVFGDPADPAQGGNECVVARNHAVPEESYLRAAEYLHTIAPDLLIGGHSWVIPDPAPLVERLRARAVAQRDALRRLSPDPEYRYWFDPFWVRADPYRAGLPAGGTVEVRIVVRNFLGRPQLYRIELHPPRGLSAAPAAIEAEVPAGETRAFAVTLSAAPGTAPGPRTVPLDVTRDGRRYGELFDLIAVVGKPD